MPETGVSSHDDDDWHSPADHVTGEAAVPHLGAHLAEATSIAEGNPDYLPIAAQALNIAKLRLICKSVRIVARLQRARYLPSLEHSI